MVHILFHFLNTEFQYKYNEWIKGIQLRSTIVVY